jgi:hypothetical protein
MFHFCFNFETLHQEHKNYRNDKRPTIKNYNKYCRPPNPFPLEWGGFSGGDYVIDVYEWSLTSCFHNSIAVALIYLDNILMNNEKKRLVRSENTAIFLRGLTRSGVCYM